MGFWGVLAMRRLVAGNWKMNGGLGEASRLAGEVRQAALGLAAVDVAVLPPFVHMQAVGQALGCNAAVGAESAAAPKASSAGQGAGAALGAASKPAAQAQAAQGGQLALGAEGAAAPKASPAGQGAGAALGAASKPAAQAQAAQGSQVALGAESTAAPKASPAGQGAGAALGAASRPAPQGSQVALGAQDLDHREPGAVTGAVSGEMLRDLGCVYVLVGHSERRQLFGEDDALVAQKFQRALEVGLAPILCLGETLEVREAGGALDCVGAQLQAALDVVGAAGLAKGVIAYEPVWAIGTGKSASPAEIAEVHGFLRRQLAKESLDKQVRVLYGGSVNVDNAPVLFAIEDVDGALVGGASLDAQCFAKICAAAENVVDG